MPRAWIGIALLLPWLSEPGAAQWNPLPETPAPSLSAAVADVAEDEVPSASRWDGWVLQAAHGSRSASGERAPNQESGFRAAYVITHRTTVLRHALASRVSRPSPPLCEWLPYHANAPPRWS